MTIQCALPSCTVLLDSSNGYRLPGSVAMTGNTGIAAFDCPSGEHICCCVEHMQQMQTYCYSNHLLPALQAAAQAKNATLQMTPPASL